MADTKPFKIAVLWRGDRAARQAATPQNNRYHRIFEELAALGIEAEPAIYDEAFADAVREQLLTAVAVLVWVDPLSGGKTRAALDAMLRDVASRGPWVSAHPDVTLKMGVKEVLFLGQPDGRVEPTLAFRDQIVNVLRHLRPHIVISMDPGAWAFDSFYLYHPDHRATALAVFDAVYPAAGTPCYVPQPDEGLPAHKVREVYFSGTSHPNVHIDITATTPEVQP